MTQYVTAPDGVRVAYEVEGAGPPLLFLHCLPCSRGYWRESGYFDALRGRFTLVAMDTRGFGESDAPDDPAAYAEERVLGDALAVMDAVGAERFKVWGHSYGATITRQLGATSDRVERIVMAGNHFGPIFPPERVARMVAYLEPLVAAQAASDPMAALEAMGVPLEEREESLAFPARTTLLTARAQANWRPLQPADLRCPALVITGTRDTRVLEALDPQREAIREAGVRMVVLPDLDHGQLVTEREAVLAVALPFLSE